MDRSGAERGCPTKRVRLNDPLMTLDVPGWPGAGRHTLEQMVASIARSLPTKAKEFA